MSMRNDIDMEELLRSWRAGVEASGERRDTEQRLGMTLSPGVPVATNSAKDGRRLAFSGDVRVERRLLPSGALQLTLAAPRELENQRITKVWLVGKKADGTRAMIGLPIESPIKEGRAIATLPESAVGGCPIDLMTAVPVRAEAELASPVESLARAVTRVLGQVAWPVEQHLQPVRAMAATDEVRETKEYQQDDGILITRRLHTADGGVLLNFEAHDDELEGALVVFPVQGKTPEGEPIYHGYAVLVKSAADPHPTALFSLSSQDELDLESQVGPVLGEKDQWDAHDIPALEWSLERAEGRTLQEALKARLDQARQTEQ